MVNFPLAEPASPPHPQHSQATSRVVAGSLESGDPNLATSSEDKQKVSPGRLSSETGDSPRDTGWGWGGLGPASSLAGRLGAAQGAVLPSAMCLLPWHEPPSPHRVLRPSSRALTPCTSGCSWGWFLASTGVALIRLLDRIQMKARRPTGNLCEGDGGMAGSLQWEAQG